jgi:hypothetical protein
VWDPWSSAGALRLGFGSAASPLPVPEAHFDGLDLGSDARGRTVAAYSACRREGPRPSCHHLRLYDVARGGERRLSSLSRQGCGESLPQISRGVIVFVRRCGDPAPLRARRAALYLKRPGKPSLRVRGLPRLAQEPLQHRGLTSFDLVGHTLAFSERRVSAELPVGSTWRVVTEVRVLRLGRRHSRVLARATKLESPTSSGTSLDHVRLDAGFAYWQRQIFGPGPQPVEQPVRQDILRRPVDGSEPASQLERAGRLYATGAGDPLGSYAVSGNRLYYTGPEPWSGPASFIAQVAGTPVFR